MAYVAPECLISSSWAGAPSDLYSLGVVLYEMITGRLPFAAEEAAQFAQAHLEQTPDDVRRHRPDTPREVALLVKRLLAKDPLRRPAATEELIETLGRMEVDALTEELAANS